jgi:hypothetical protein
MAWYPHPTEAEIVWTMMVLSTLTALFGMWVGFVYGW